MEQLRPPDEFKFYKVDQINLKFLQNVSFFSYQTVLSKL